MLFDDIDKIRILSSRDFNECERIYYFRRKLGSLKRFLKAGTALSANAKRPSAAQPSLKDFCGNGIGIRQSEFSYLFQHESRVDSVSGCDQVCVDSPLPFPMRHIRFIL
jgi:hypothetical protein